MEEKERQVKGIWIPIEIWKDTNLSWNEKILFLEIDSFTTQEKDCYISNEYIAQLLNVGETTANKILSSLIKKGYVVKTRFDGRHRYVKSALHFTTGQGCTKVQGWVADDANPFIYNNNIDNLPNTITKTNNIKELKEKFGKFVLSYKKAGGRVRGVDTEFDEFSKRHKDWKQVIPYLETALQREVKARNQAKANKTFFPEIKNLRTYLGKQRAWEMFVTIGEDITKEEYIPLCGGALNWNDYYKCYMYVGFWDGHIADGYSDDERPDGASVTLNNGRGTIVWDKGQKQWIRE